MSALSMEDKKNLILDYERARARQLARRVIEKPVPPIWMILIPVFFVFYAWKIKQYSNGLKDFADHYMVSRRLALDTAFEAEQGGTPPEIGQLIENTDTIPQGARSCYRDWLSLLIEHYRNLLVASGLSTQDLIRSHYRNKSTYLLFNNTLNTTENTFNKALLPDIEGDRQDIKYIFDRMEQSLADLRRLEVEEIFS